jgi:type II secretory pathway component PulM
VLTLVFWGFIWEPLRADHRRLRASLPPLRAQAEEFSRNADEAKRLRGMRQTARPGASPRAAIEAVAGEVGLKPSIKFISEAPGGRLQVGIDPVSYEALVRWIGTLASTAGIAVDAVQLRPGPTPGTVLVETLVLRGPGPS